MRSKDAVSAFGCAMAASLMCQIMGAESALGMTLVAILFMANGICHAIKDAP